jgi:hypothetical protein
MPISRKTAEKLMTTIVLCGTDLVSTIPDLETELTPEELRKMKREIGRIISVMDCSISAKIAHQYPDLAPEAVPIAHPL